MKAILISSLLLAAPSLAQDVIWGMGFSAGGDPLTTDTPNPMHRFKDLNGDGIYTDNEIFSLVNVDATTSSNSFVPDMGWCFENGRLTFYWSEGDNNEAYVVRGQDLDNNGILEAGEVTTWFTPPANTFYRDPEAIAVWRNPATNRTVVYISNTETSGGAGSGSTPLGIIRLEDVDGNGTVDPATESNVHVDASVGLTVPGKNGGTVAIGSTNWINLRIHPDGDLLAYANGGFVTATQDPVTGALVYGTNPDTFAWLRFADNGAGNAPTASVFMNMSQLNDMPQFVDFTNGTLPTADMNPSFGNQTIGLIPSAGYHQFTFLDIDVGGGLGGRNVYYFGSESRSTSGQALSDGVNNPEPIQSGVVFRAEDLNLNGDIDPGEMTLWSNFSVGTFGGLPTANTGTNLFDVGVWDMSAANGRVQFAHDESVFTFDDANQNGVIELGEVTEFMPDQTQGTSLLYGNGFGPFIDGARSLPANSMAGPFAAGFQPVGDGCIGATSGRIAQIDAYGSPDLGSTFTIRALNVGTAFDLVFLVVGDQQISTPIGPLPGCTQYSSAQNTFAPVFPNPAGFADFAVTIPNAPALVGAVAVFQSAFLDSNAPTNRPLPVYTTNGLVVTVQ